jgi:hypothetical protein
LRLRRAASLLASVAASALWLAPAAVAELEHEVALAERYAPVVRLVEQTEECGPGEPYQPTDVELLFDEPTVALRGPWTALDLVKIGPLADDLVERYEYHLDFPGNALEPGCDYERWARRLTGGSEPVVYAHVAAEPAAPGRIGLPYWFFYPFNDFNNTHEGDWEMIQLLFDAQDAEEALGEEPVEVGFSSHEGAESAAWADEKLEVVDGTHPVVYPAAGSHANKFTAALYLGSSAEAGVGCDDTRGPHVEVRPSIRTIPSDPAAGASAFPWITFEGRWGELQKAFFNGPTGPNLKGQWTEPITWSEGWRDRSYAVPTGGLFGTSATDLFCSGVAAGSRGLVQLLRNPVPLLLFLGALLGLVVFVIVRATWTPVAPLRLARRRAWGQIFAASARMYARRVLLFLGLGLLFVPLTIVITALQWLAVEAADLVGTLTGEAAGGAVYVGVLIGTTLTLFGFTLLQAATACALRELDTGRSVGPLDAYRFALAMLRPLFRASAIVVAVWLVLAATTVLIPVAIWLLVRWSLVAPVVELEGGSAVQALRRSAELVRGRWLRVGSLVGLSAVIAFAAGPLLGVGLIFATDMPLAVLNLVAGVVYVLALPFVAIVTTYVYCDARTRAELEPRDERTELPAEVELGGARG